MKKTKLKNYAMGTHFQVMTDFLASLVDTFPECEETKDVQIVLRNVVMHSDAEMQKSVEAWRDTMITPLKKGCAKYSKAIESITGKQAVVFHACAYRDVAAIDASSESPTLNRIDLKGKLESPAFTTEMKDTFWEYMDQLNRTAMEALGEALPNVPTREEIQEDIMHRKGKTNSPSGSTETVLGGIVEGVTRLFALREEDVSLPPGDAIVSCIEAAGTVMDPSGTSLTLQVKNKVPDSFCSMLKLIVPTHELKNYSAATDEEWDMLNRIIGLVTMKSAIGDNMMSGIERMANKIVDDIAQGKTDMSSLNVESIGKEVLSSVSASDMTQFANNIDKLLPALSQFKPPNM